MMGMINTHLQTVVVVGAPGVMEGDAGQGGRWGFNSNVKLLFASLLSQW